jgi:hypothetical protein
MSILVLTSDTLIGTPATGNIEYNGQFFGTDSAGSRAQLQRIVRATAVASTSGTSISFTSIPAWVEKITVMFSGVSTNGSGNYQIQIGSGSVATSGYLGSTGYFTSGALASAATTGFLIYSPSGAAVVAHGTTTLTLLNSATNTWVATSIMASSQAAQMLFGAGSISLAGTLDQLRIIGSATGSPADTFDAGSVNIIYEG